jgi:FtsP/CotA-like multicopper oxidase with cupredoxin domain
MDGVEGVSREPIAPGESFVYDFVAEPAGTHWYHSHVGVQYGNGLFGPFVVEEMTPIASYDRDEVLLINDWFLESGDALLAGLMNLPPMVNMPATKKATPKMNMSAMKKMARMDDMPGMAMAMMDVGDVPFQSGLVNGKGRAPGTMGRLTTVEVSDGETVRLRLINGSSTYTFRFQIDGHPLTLIASDGSPLKPIVVDNLTFAPGERYDVLLRAQGQGVHWIRAVTLDGRETRAVLQYRGQAQAEPNATPIRWGSRSLMPEMMRSPAPVTLTRDPRELPIPLGGTMKPYRWSIGGQYYPRADPITVHRGESIRFVFRNPTGMDHPFHLHGHSFYVLGKPGALNLKDPALKDTVIVPARSDLVVQWVADNPGRWFFHCHIEWHLATGMARVIEVS